MGDLIFSVALSCCGRNKGVNANFVFWQIPVGHKPSPFVELVEEYHIVVCRGVKRQSVVLRLVELSTFIVVQRHENVIPTQTVLTLSSKEQSHSVIKQYRIILVEVGTVNLMNLLRFVPRSSQMVNGEETCAVDGVSVSKEVT